MSVSVEELSLTCSQPSRITHLCFPKSSQTITMAISSSVTAGIVIAIFSFLLLILVALYYSHRRRTHNTPSKATTPSSPTGSSSPTLPPSQLTRSKRLTGIQNVQQQQHTRFPSLENGPGPTLITTPPTSTPNIPTTSTIRAVTITPARSPTSATMQRPATTASNKRSSLHQAVLGVGTTDSQMNNSDTTKEAGEKIGAQNLNANPGAGVERPKAYTGAWP